MESTHCIRPVPGLAAVVTAMATAMAMALTVMPATAQVETPDEPPAWRFSGYYTLGYSALQSSAARHFARDQSQLQPSGWEQDSRLGLQLDGRLSPTLSATVQGVIRHHVPSTPLSQSIEWAFLRWTPSEAWQIRLGRTSPDLYLYADVRSVGIAYPWVRPSQEFYAWMPLQSMDGVDATRLWSRGDANWRLKLSFGHASTKLAAQDSGVSAQGKLHAIRAATLTRETPTWTVKATYLKARLDLRDASYLVALGQGLAQLQALTLPVLPVLAAEAGQLRQGLGVNSDVRYLSLGTQHDLNDWLVTAEWSATLGYTRRQYLSIGHRLGAFTPFVLAGQSRLIEPAYTAPGHWAAQLAPLVGSVAAAQAVGLGAAAAGASNLGRISQRSLGIGVRWDLRANLALKLQHDHVQIQADGRALWAMRPGYDNADFRARVWSLALDGSF